MVSCSVNAINDCRTCQAYCVQLAMYIVVGINVHNNMSTPAKSSVSLQQMYHISVTANYHGNYKVTLFKSDKSNTEQVLAVVLYISCFLRDSLFISVSKSVSH